MMGQQLSCAVDDLFHDHSSSQSWHHDGIRQILFSMCIIIQVSKPVPGTMMGQLCCAVELFFQDHSSIRS